MEKIRPDSLPLEELNKRLKEKGFELAEPYKGSINWRHLIKCHCGKVREANLKQALRKHVNGCGCRRGAGVLNSFKLNKFPKVLMKLHDMKIYLIEQYHGMWKEHKLICHCGKEFSCKLSSILYDNKKGCGCSKVQP